MVAVAGGVGGEVWTCDEHTNKILLHVCCMNFLLVVRSVSSLCSELVLQTRRYVLFVPVFELSTYLGGISISISISDPSLLLVAV